MASSPENRYDAVPYDAQAFIETHPDVMAVLARLHGLEPPPVPTARVLELGCADGSNLIPLAVALPGADLLGVDLSSRQIAAGQELIARLSLRRIELRTASITELGADLGTFDYIICHGVYSWVPADVRAGILDLCARLLAPQGVAFVSYNTVPGWYPLGLVRGMMQEHARSIPEPESQVRAARAFLEVLLRSLPDPTSLYAQLLEAEIGDIRTKTNSYVLHEYMEQINEPFSFCEFLSDAMAHGLRYLADARYHQAAESQPAAVVTALDRLAGADPLRREQVLDYLCNRRFRRSLLVHSDAAPRSPRPADLESLRALMNSQASAPFDPAAPAVLELTSPDGARQYRTSDPLAKAAFRALAAAWPGSLPVPELRRRAHALLREQPARIAFDPSPDAFNVHLLQAFHIGTVDLGTFEPPLVAGLAAAPAASPIARLQAETASRLVNLRHQYVQLSEFDRLVIRQLDGGRDRDAIADRLVAAVADGSFSLVRDGQPLSDPVEARRVLARSLEPSLQRLRQAALLVG